MWKVKLENFDFPRDFKKGKIKYVEASQFNFFVFVLKLYSFFQNQETDMNLKKDKNK